MIHVVRHGAAFADEEIDPGLSDVGRLQVERLADRGLAGHALARVLHGPKRRAAETASTLAERFGVTVEPSMLLDDRTAVPSPSRRTDYAAHQLPWLDEVPLEARDVDGAAMSAAWHELWSAHTTSEVVLVTHSFVVAWFVREALCAPPAAWMQLMANNATQISIALDPHGGSSLVAFNQRC